MLLIFVLLKIGNGFHFNLENNVIRCFHEDMPADTQFRAVFTMLEIFFDV